MEKLTLKDAFLVDARYDFIRDGINRGAFALCVKLGDPERADAGACADLVLGAHRRKWPPRKIVRFAGAIDLAHPRVLALLASFHEYGFETHIDTTRDDLAVPRPEVTLATLRTSKPFVSHSFNEIVYSPTHDDIESGKLASFTFPVAPTHGVVALWLNVAAGDAKIDDVERFLRESPWSWQVAL